VKVQRGGLGRKIIVERLAAKRSYQCDGPARRSKRSHPTTIIPLRTYTIERSTALDRAGVVAGDPGPRGVNGDGAKELSYPMS
jgi:hypothetical protein